MSRRRRSCAPFGVLFGLASTSFASQASQQEPAVSDEGVLMTGSVVFSEEELERILELSPLPEPPPDPTNEVYENPAAARLGQALFFDARLSKDGSVSCSTCHIPDKGWGDGLPVAQALDEFPRHSMTIWNVAYNRWFFWDGRRDSLWSQALAPLEDPREHGGSRLQYLHLMAEDADYTRAYEDVFGPLPDFSDRERFPDEARPVAGDPSHPHAEAWRRMSVKDRDTANRVYSHLGKAIAAFERQIVSRHAPFDEFVEGLREKNPTKQRSLSESARRGLKLFLGKARCHLCHSGPNFTDKEFHDDRVPDRSGARFADLGRFKGIDEVQADPFNGIGRYSADTGGEAKAKIAYLQRGSHNIHEFKTPSLRNVAVTAPYMHQGQLETLADVIAFYSTLKNAAPAHRGGDRLLQPLHLSEDEAADLLAFLESLTSTELPPELLQAPPVPYLED